MGEPSPNNGSLGAGHGKMANAPQAQGISPPPFVFHVADEVGIEDTHKDFPVRHREYMKFFKQTRQVCDQIERREVRRNEVHAAPAIERGAGQELRIASGVKRDSPRLDKAAAADREVLA